MPAIPLMKYLAPTLAEIKAPDFLKERQDIEVANNDANITINGKPVSGTEHPETYDFIKRLRRHPAFKSHWTEINKESKTPADFTVEGDVVTMRGEDGKVLATASKKEIDGETVLKESKIFTEVKTQRAGDLTLHIWKNESDKDDFMVIVEDDYGKKVTALVDFYNNENPKFDWRNMRSTYDKEKFKKIEPVAMKLMSEISALKESVEVPEKHFTQRTYNSLSTATEDASDRNTRKVVSYDRMNPAPDLGKGFEVLKRLEDKYGNIEYYILRKDDDYFFVVDADQDPEEYTSPEYHKKLVELNDARLDAAFKPSPTNESHTMPEYQEEVGKALTEEFGRHAGLNADWNSRVWMVQRNGSKVLVIVENEDNNTYELVLRDEAVTDVGGNMKDETLVNWKYSTPADTIIKEADEKAMSLDESVKPKKMIPKLEKPEDKPTTTNPPKHEPKVGPDIKAKDKTPKSKWEKTSSGKTFAGDKSALKKPLRKSLV